MIIICES